MERYELNKMAPGVLTEASIPWSDFIDAYRSRVTPQLFAKNSKNSERVSNRVDVSSVNGKLDFLLSMGLEFTNCCDINHNNNNNTSDTENKNANSNKNHDLRASSERPCISHAGINERMGQCVDNPNSQSFARDRRPRDEFSEADMLGNHRPIPLLGECSVRIAGAKCKFCGRCFKCITDVEYHVKKKHRKKRPRKKLVFKIGDEVVSRLLIKKKHLKWLDEEEQRRKLPSVSSTSGRTKDFCRDRYGDERTVPFAKVTVDCDAKQNASRVINTENYSPVSSESDDRSSVELGKLVANEEEEEEDVQMVLKITRPCRSTEINHETPNRTERELLLSDAFREFIRIEKGFGGIGEPLDDLNIYRESDKIVEEFNRLEDTSLGYSPRLDREESNCSFRVETADEDTDSYAQDVHSLLQEDDRYFNDETASIHSEHYRNENGDIVPDFIDYSLCLDDRISYNNNNIHNSLNNNNNNKICEWDSSFYESRQNQWKKAIYEAIEECRDGASNVSKSLDSPVLIKEEIILEDYL